MPKVEVYDLVKKKNVFYDSRLAEALIKMKRAKPVEENGSKSEDQTYNTRVLTAENNGSIVEQTKVIEAQKTENVSDKVNPPKRRGRPPANRDT